MSRTVAHSSGPGETVEIARRFAESVRPGDVVLLAGPLAAGKTVFVRGLCDGLGGDDDEVSSPTFVLVQTYRCDGRRGIERLHHVDLYRLRDAPPAALSTVGLEDLLDDPDAVTAIEWAEVAPGGLLPGTGLLEVVIGSVGDGDERTVTLPSPGDRPPQP